MTSDSRGWSALRHDEHTKKMGQIINDNIDHLPAAVSVQADEGSVVQMRTSDTIVRFKFHAVFASRYEEKCRVTDYSYVCWRCRRRLLLWECKEAGKSLYYTQKVSKRRFKAESLYALFEMSRLQPCAVHTATEMLLQGKKLRDVVLVREVVVLLYANTVRVEFKYKKNTEGKKKQSEFSLPKAVNICYTGCIHGNINQSSLVSVSGNKNAKGPCGSEMHIDTSMGVMQIFSNKSGYRKITCKAFQNKKEAEFVVDYVCNAVHCYVFFVPHFVVYLFVLRISSTSQRALWGVPPYGGCWGPTDLPFAINT